MKVKKYIAIGMMIVLVFCLGGCVKIGKNSPRNKVVAYMNQKYPSDTFTYKGALDNTLYYVNSANYPDPGGGYGNVCVWYSVDRNGQEHFCDNYLDVKYYDQTMALSEEVLEEAFPGQKYTLSEGIDFSPVCTKTGSDSMTFEEYISDPDASLCIIAKFEDDGFAWEDASEREAIEARMLNSLTSRNAYMDGNIIIETDDGSVCFRFEMSSSLDKLSWVEWTLNYQKIEEN